MTDDLGIAVIGCGHWGKNLVRNFSELGVLRCVVDENPENARAMATLYSVEAETFDDVCHHPDIDAVVIATPAVTHFDLAIRALKSGKHVFVEKPVALNIADAEEMILKAKEMNKILMVGHLLQYHPAFLKIHELCWNGSLGKLRYVYSNRLNLGKLRTEENILWSFAPHDISMCLSLFGTMPQTVIATGQAYVTSGIVDVTTTHMKFDDGRAAHIHVSWLHPFKEQRLVVIGEKAMVVFDDSLGWDEKVQLYSHEVDIKNGIPDARKADAEKLPIRPTEPLKIECQHFVDCVLTGESPRTDAEEGLRVLKVLDAAQHSLDSSTAVEIQ